VVETTASNLSKKKEELLARLREAADIAYAGAVLAWDQSTYMPARGAEDRARQLAVLERIAHEKNTDPAIGRLLDELQPYAESLPADSDDAALVRVARRDYERRVRIPADFAGALAEHTAATYTAWTLARPQNDFAAVRPSLERTLDMSRQLADFFPGYRHIMDPLIDWFDEGMNAELVGQVFEELRAELAPMVQRIAGQDGVDDAFLRRHYPEVGQWAFGVAVIQEFGYDFARGRQDKTFHPYMTKFGHDDVRITTRVDEHDLAGALFSTLHESGHALYELGIDPAFAGTPLDTGTSAGVHESQSRLWENIVGRSAGFWQHYYPRLRDAFPGTLQDVGEEQFYRAVNKVQPSLIRTEADEITYNLHVILRFQLEKELLEGKLAVADLPDAWHAAYERNLGVRAPDDRDGVLQDVHWFSGPIGGAFQGYTLGNIMAAQFYAAAVAAQPQIPAEIAAGRFATLHGWLRAEVYRHGRKYTAGELLQRTTGRELTLAPYLQYLRQKYGAIYSL
jgi:carboxypeptidase Taq